MWYSCYQFIMWQRLDLDWTYRKPVYISIRNEWFRYSKQYFDFMLFWSKQNYWDYYWVGNPYLTIKQLFSEPTSNGSVRLTLTLSVPGFVDPCQGLRYSSEIKFSHNILKNLKGFDKISFSKVLTLFLLNIDL